MNRVSCASSLCAVIVAALRHARSARNSWSSTPTNYVEAVAQVRTDAPAVPVPDEAGATSARGHRQPVSRAFVDWMNPRPRRPVSLRGPHAQRAQRRRPLGSGLPRGRRSARRADRCLRAHARRAAPPVCDRLRDRSSWRTASTDSPSIKRGRRGPMGPSRCRPSRTSNTTSPTPEDDFHSQTALLEKINAASAIGLRARASRPTSSC